MLFEDIMRVKFKSGQQRKFIEKVLANLYCPSLRALNQFGIDINYSSLKSYFNENRTLPKDLFDELCLLAKINPIDWNVQYLDENWGRIKGGKR